MDKVTVYSSHGRLEVNANTGGVFHCTSKNAVLNDIVYINLAEYRNTYGELDETIDILDVGYTMVGGKYVPPDKSFRENLPEHTYNVEFSAVCMETMQVKAQHRKQAIEKGKKELQGRLQNGRAVPEVDWYQVKSCSKIK